jgi:uncharacterized membrane protein (DUF4010 family)
MGASGLIERHIAAQNSVQIKDARKYAKNGRASRLHAAERSLMLPASAHFPPSEVAAKIFASLGIGLLVGIEREWSNKDMGVRTFALISLLGTLAALSHSSLALLAFVGVFLIVILANTRSLLTSRSLETTTSAALLVIFVLGALVGEGHLFTAVSSAILMTMLLTWKVELRKFAGGLNPAEIRSAVLLGLLALVVYPILPNRYLDKWNLINPRQVWLTVIVIAGIGFVNYVLLKIYGERGLYLSGFLGGFVNSSAAALELAKPLGSAQGATGTALASLLLTIVAMFIRNLIILALFAPSAVYVAAPPIAAMIIVAAIFVQRARRDTHENPVELHLESPVSLRRVFAFTAFFLAIQILSTFAERYLGRFGFLGVSVLGGLVSSASTSAAAANLVGHAEIAAGLAGAGVVLASVASALINLPIIHRNAKNPALIRPLTRLTLIINAVGILCLILESYRSLFKF